MLENWALRKIFVSNKDEVTGDWKKLHNEELNDLLTQYCSGDQIEKNELGGACSRYEREERRIQGFGGETCGKETTWNTMT
jgi:hypothetical protein